MAPELLSPGKFGLPNGRVSKQADIYAFGMVVYEVLTGRTPFAGEGRWLPEIIMGVMEGHRPSKPENAEDIGFGKGTWELVQRCWDENRNRRPTVDSISKHFKHVATTSKVVPPVSSMSAPTVGHPTVSEPGSGSRDSCECLVWPKKVDQISLYAAPAAQLFVPSSQTSSSVIQFRIVADGVAGGGILHSETFVPNVELFDRLAARINGRRPALRPSMRIATSVELTVPPGPRIVSTCSTIHNTHSK